MKKITFPQIFIIISSAWLLIFAYFFFQFTQSNQELSDIVQNSEEIDNLLFYERNIQTLELEYENVSRQSYTTKSISEFIAMLPKLGETSGILDISIENTGVSIENDFEINRLTISSISDFFEIANFIDILERSKLPIQIETLEMVSDDGELVSTMSVKIYKKIIED